MKGYNMDEINRDCPYCRIDTRHNWIKVVSKNWKCPDGDIWAYFCHECWLMSTWIVKNGVIVDKSVATPAIVVKARYGVTLDNSPRNPRFVPESEKRKGRYDWGGK